MGILFSSFLTPSSLSAAYCLESLWLQQVLHNRTVDSKLPCRVPRLLWVGLVQGRRANEFCLTGTWGKDAWRAVLRFQRLNSAEKQYCDRSVMPGTSSRWGEQGRWSRSKAPAGMGQFQPVPLSPHTLPHSLFFRTTVDV